MAQLGQVVEDLAVALGVELQDVLQRAIRLVRAARAKGAGG